MVEAWRRVACTTCRKRRVAFVKGVHPSSTALRKLIEAGSLGNDTRWLISEAVSES